jgi:hypothetical protein
MSIEVTSTAFQQGMPIPKQYKSLARANPYCRSQVASLAGRCDRASS